MENNNYKDDKTHTVTTSVTFDKNVFEGLEKLAKFNGFEVPELINNIMTEKVQVKPWFEDRIGLEVQTRMSDCYNTIQDAKDSLSYIASTQINNDKISELCLNFEQVNDSLKQLYNIFDSNVKERNING